MSLDQATIYIITALISLVLGAVLLAARATGRFGAWAACWGGGNVALGLAGLDQLLADVLPKGLLTAASNVTGIAGCVLIVQGARLLGGRAPRWAAVAAVLALLVLPLALSHAPGDRVLRIAYNNLVLAACDLWIASEAVRMARRERLHTAWIMVGLFVVTVPVSLARSGMAILAALGSDMLDHGSVGPWLAALLAAFWSLRGAVPALLAAERTSQALAAVAGRDLLTGVLNRNGFDTVRRTAAGRVSVMMMDLDHFKLLNDRYGHARGDAVLCLLAETVRRHQPQGAAFVRFGGDEFVLVLPDVAIHSAERLAETIRTDFAAAIAQCDVAAPMPTISIGIAEDDVGPDGLDALLARADAALYASKRAGRDRISMERLAA